jgi:two-component system chemotaxis response regulator CheB
VLPTILDRAGPLSAFHPRDGERIRRGQIYVALPDHHLLIDREHEVVRLSRGPKENRSRPAIDPLFRSAALAYGPRVIGIVLTGSLDDGSAGLWAVRQCGGTAIVQDPNEAVAPSMPLNALQRVDVQHCAPLAQIGPLLVRLTSEPASAKEAGPLPNNIEMEVKIAHDGKSEERSILEWGEPSIYACPECHGVLMQLKEGGGVRFRCHTGHAYSVDTLLAEFGEKSEDALWNAIRALEETVILLERMAAHAEGHHPNTGDALRDKARQTHERLKIVRQALLRPEAAGLAELAGA